MLSCWSKSATLMEVLWNMCWSMTVSGFPSLCCCKNIARQLCLQPICQIQKIKHFCITNTISNLRLSKRKNHTLLYLQSPPCYRSSASLTIWSNRASVCCSRGVSGVSSVLCWWCILPAEPLQIFITRSCGTCLILHDMYLNLTFIKS